MTVQALQDYDYMGKHFAQDQDPFIVTGERLIERQMLEAAMKEKEYEADPLEGAESTMEWEPCDVHPKPVDGVRYSNFRESWIRGFQRRLSAAAVGGTPSYRTYVAHGPSPYSLHEPSCYNGVRVNLRIYHGLAS